MPLCSELKSELSNNETRLTIERSIVNTVEDLAAAGEGKKLPDEATISAAFWRSTSEQRFRRRRT
jgi:hypothetical protein